MSTVLQRASFSPIIYDMVDYSNAIFDADLQLIGQTNNCPIHLAAMHFSAHASVDRFGIDNVNEGDVILVNDPYEGGSHTNDMTLTVPIFFEGERLGFAVNRAHWTDVGGGGAGGMAFGTHIAAEGLRLPPIKLVEAGELNQDFVSVIRNATRMPQYVDGDLQAQIGALRVGEAEFHRLAQRYGLETFRAGMAEVIDYTERMTRAAIDRIPDGVYEADEYADTDGFQMEPVRLHVRITVDGDEIEVDMSGTDPQAIGSINSPYATSASAVYYALKFFGSPDSPSNAGMYRPISIKIPKGTWLNCEWPAPTIASTVMPTSKICAAIWQALAQAIPERIVAPTYAECNWFVAQVTDPETGIVSVFSDLPAGGWGGTPFNDGMSVTQDPLNNCKNLPAETAEMLFPVEYEAFEFRTDSGGAGQYRGGVGAEFKVRCLGRTELSMECARTREGSPGVGGGLASPPQHQKMVKRDGSVETIGGLTPEGEWTSCLLASHPFAADEVFFFQSTGGGGWGNPWERDPEAVLTDVIDGLVSLEAARDTYRVAFKESNDPSADVEVDHEATVALRASAG